MRSFSAEGKGRNQEYHERSTSHSSSLAQLSLRAAVNESANQFPNILTDSKSDEGAPVTRMTAFHIRMSGAHLHIAVILQQQRVPEVPLIAVVAPSLLQDANIEERLWRNFLTFFSLHFWRSFGL